MTNAPDKMWIYDEAALFFEQFRGDPPLPKITIRRYLTSAWHGEYCYVPVDEHGMAYYNREPVDFYSNIVFSCRLSYFPRCFDEAVKHVPYGAVVIE